MQVDRVIFPVRSLGPGNRMVIWTVGCDLKCPGCSSPDLRLKDKTKDIAVDKLGSMIDAVATKSTIDGFTITGGEPFAQPSHLLILLKHISLISRDILIYTGYTLKELEKIPNNYYAAEILNLTAVLIDGPYISSLNDGKPLRGSSNQTIHMLKSEYSQVYKDYQLNQRIIENFLYNNNLISVGIHNQYNSGA